MKQKGILKNVKKEPELIKTLAHRGEKMKTLVLVLVTLNETHSVKAVSLAGLTYLVQIPRLGKVKNLNASRSND